MGDPDLIDDDEIDEQLQREQRSARRARQMALIKGSHHVLRMMETAERLPMSDPAATFLAGNAIGQLERLARIVGPLSKEMPARKRRPLSRIEVVRIPLPDPPKQIEEAPPDPPPVPETGEPPAPEPPPPPDEPRAVACEIVDDTPPAKPKTRFEQALDLVMGVRKK
jgi:hypothetical protein